MKYVKPILAFIVFIIMQLVASFALSAISMATNPDFYDAAVGGDPESMIMSTSPVLLATLVLIADILCIVIVSAMKLIDWKTVVDWSRIKGKSIILPLALGLAGCLAINVFSEICGVEDNLEDLFVAMTHSVWGFVVVSFLGPILEEMCFREALIGGLLRQGAKPWIAIFVSALLFGLTHFNPAQSLAGFFIGLILGIIYYKTGNIVLSSLLHICNNTTASVLCITTDKDSTFSDMVGGDTTAMLIGSVAAIACIMYFVKYCKNEPATPPTAADEMAD